MEQHLTKGEEGRGKEGDGSKGLPASGATVKSVAGTSQRGPTGRGRRAGGGDGMEPRGEKPPHTYIELIAMAISAHVGKI